MLSLLGASLFALCWNLRKIFFTASYINLIFCSVILLEYLFQKNLGIDQLFVRDNQNIYASIYPGRTALISILVNIGLIIASILAAKNRYKASQTICFMVFFSTYATLLGHSFGLMNLYYSPIYSGMAVHTAFSIILLTFSILVYQIKKGWLTHIFKSLQSANILKHLFVYFTICCPFFIAAYFKILHASSMSNELGTIVILLLISIFCVPVTYFTFQALNRMENDLRKSKERLELALQAGSLGSYDITLQSGKIQCNERFRKNFGLEEEEFSYTQLVDSILPQFRDAAHNAIQRAIVSGEHYQIEYQIAHKNGLTHWIRASGQAQYNLAGKATNITGVSWVIQGKDKETKELARAYETAKLSAEASQIGIFDHDFQRNYIEWNPYTRMLFGIDDDREINFQQDCLNNLHPEDRDRIRQDIANAKIKNISNGVYNAKYRIVNPLDRRVRWVQAKGQVFFDDNNTPIRFTGTITDITEQHESEMLKNDFIAMVSHELKTPLTTLKAYIQTLLLRANKNNDENSKVALIKADTQIKKMGTMIKGFLDVSRLESGRMSLCPSSFDLNVLIEEVINDLNTATNCSHRIAFNKQALPLAWADREKIAHVITNLIGNAIKYSEKGKLIEISCDTQHNSNMLIAIKDEGFGIPQKDLTFLFDRYYRVDNQRTAHISGFGIGLYLCAEIIKLHNGKIGVTSTIGKGSTFHFQLPVTKQEE